MCTTPKSASSRHERFVTVDWQDCGWCPLITVRMPVAATPRRRAVKPLSMPLVFPYPPRRNPAFTTMKTMPIRSRRPCAGFTIVELLTVIAIIAILAAMLLPTLGAARRHAQRVQARLEIDQIAQAILKYDSDYGRFPVSTNVQSAAGTFDFTYGGTLVDGAGNVTGYVNTEPGPPPGVMMTNEEVIGILMDATNYPNGNPVLPNLNYAKNPQQTIYLNPKMSDYNPAVDKGQPPGGLDLNGAYRDPWGNPYIITMDLNYDESCRDSFYCQKSVSQSQLNSQIGLNGLFNSDANGASDNFQYRGKVMVWSAGPDGKIDSTALSAGVGSANAGVNKDNVLSWQ
jgi:prepilin-type N-terminal cleavage/methylation domain-containing protein